MTALEDDLQKIHDALASIHAFAPGICSGCHPVDYQVIYDALAVIDAILLAQLLPSAEHYKLLSISVRLKVLLPLEVES